MAGLGRWNAGLEAGALGCTYYLGVSVWGWGDRGKV